MATTRKDFIYLFVAVFLLTMMLLLPLPDPIMDKGRIIAMTFQGKAALSILIFVVFLWVSEALPFAVSGFIGMSLMVIFGAASFKDLVKEGFGNDIIMFLIGVTIFSTAISSTNIMKRVTVFFLHKLGHSPKLIILVFLAVGTIISAWISDMAVAAMLTPIGVSIMRGTGLKPLESNFGRALLISCSWGAVIGGIMTPAGCAPNPLTIGYLKDLAQVDIKFIHWSAIGIPAALAMVPFAWLLLLKFFPLEKDVDLHVSADDYRKRISEIGPVSRREVLLLAIFALTISLWVCEPFIKQWSCGRIGYLSISYVAITCACLLFLPGIEVLSWRQAEEEMGWGSIILISTGLAIGGAFFKTGGAEWMAWKLFRSIGSLNPVLIVFVIVIGVSIMKVMFSSNTVTSIIAVPLLIALGKEIHISPALLAIPAGITSSLAFILVTSTPTNVVSYQAGYYTMWDMAKVGVWMTIIGAVFVTLSICVVGNMLGIIPV